MIAHWDVFLRGRRIGGLTSASEQLSFQYDPVVLEQHGSSSVVLSLSLPVTEDNIDGPEVFSYFDGLLPLMENRRAQADEHNLSPSDTLGFLSVVGPTLSGAVKVVPAEMAKGLATTDLESVPEPIMKRQNVTELIPNLLVAEEWALRVARTAGLPAVDADLLADGTLSVTRFDYTPQGQWLHQEDFGQALGLVSAEMYEEHPSTPSRLTQLITLAEPHMQEIPSFKRSLLRLITFNLLIGNGDAHSKNYSLLIHEDGKVLLAPLYDVAPTQLLFEAPMPAGHALSGEKRLSALTLEHVVREGMAWGLSGEDAHATTVSVLEGVSQTAMIEAVDERIGFLPELVAARAQDLLNGGTARLLTKSRNSSNELFDQLFGRHLPPPIP